MKCQILFSGKNKKNVSKCCLLKILPQVKCVSKEYSTGCVVGLNRLFFVCFLKVFSFTIIIAHNRYEDSRTYHVC